MLALVYNVVSGTRTPIQRQIDLLVRWGPVLTCIFGLAYVALFTWTAWNRLFYPFELEWMEGAMVDQVRRILDGLPLYVEPSIEYTPFIYAPLYFYLSAALSALMGIGLEPLRVVSISATFGCFILLALIVRRESQSWLFACVAAGLYAGS